MLYHHRNSFLLPDYCQTRVLVVRSFLNSRRAVAALILAFGGAVPAAAGPVEAARGMVPHKALYEIDLVARKSSTPIIDISGQMMFEWKTGCDAWITNHRFNLFYEYAETTPLRVTSDFSTYEPYDGQSFDFTSQRKRNGALYQELRGSAVRDPASNGGVASYQRPEGLSFTLPPGSYFPMAHTMSVLEKARAGERFFNATVFDGSDEDGPVEINTFIGSPAAPQPREASENLQSDLLASPARHVRMAFFPLDKENEDAEYEMSLVFHENGIISDMRVEYREFSVTQKLIALEELAVPDCPP